MNFIEDLKRLRKIHELISGQNTGSPEKLAAAICVSRSELYYILRELKKMGAQISYDRRKRSFCYVNNFKLDMEIKVSYLGEQEMSILGCGHVGCRMCRGFCTTHLYRMSPFNQTCFIKDALTNLYNIRST